VISVGRFERNVEGTVGVEGIVTMIGVEEVKGGVASGLCAYIGCNEGVYSDRLCEREHNTMV
jgi:hypothetical protein